MKKFFLMTRGRTGSTAIIDVLNKSNNLCVFQELFLNYAFNKEKQHLVPPYDLWKKRGNVTSVIFKKISKESRNIKDYLISAEKIVTDTGVEALGFKLLSHNFDERPNLKTQLIKRDFKVVYLIRNIPRQVISGMVAKLRGKYNAHDRENYNDDASYPINISEFKSLVEWETQAVANDIAMLESSDFEFIQVRYEDFVHNHDVFFTRIFDFLNIPAEKLPNSSFSIMIKDLEQVVQNYQEVEHCLAEMGMSIE